MAAGTSTPAEDTARSSSGSRMGSSGQAVTARWPWPTFWASRAIRRSSGFTSATKVSACPPRHSSIALVAAATPSDTMPSNSNLMLPSEIPLASSPAMRTVVDPTTASLMSATVNLCAPKPTKGPLLPPAHRFRRR